MLLKMETTAMFTAVVLAIALPAAGALAAEYPIAQAPCNRAAELAEPACTFHATIQASLNELQRQELSRMAEEPAGARTCFFNGLTCALEEYWYRELSYPRHVQDLLDAGCLLEEWRQAGWGVEDYSAQSTELDERTLIYVPQPVGLAELILPPGKSGCLTMRQYNEYCLFIPEAKAVDWGLAEIAHRASWSAFDGRGIQQVLFVSRIEPGRTRCAF